MTSRFALRLPQRQARLVSLAVHYHLARPGAELDPDTMSPYPHGLGELPSALDPRLLSSLSRGLEGAPAPAKPASGPAEKREDFPWPIWHR